MGKVDTRPDGTTHERTELEVVTCRHCGEEHETWGYDDLRSQRTGKVIRYSNHSCPRLRDIDKFHTTKDKECE